MGSMLEEVHKHTLKWRDSYDCAKHSQLFRESTAIIHWYERLRFLLLRCQNLASEFHALMPWQHMHGKPTLTNI